MNEVDAHPTDETCNFCGGNVISQYGSRSCNNPQCEAYGHSDPDYDDDPSDTNPIVEKEFVNYGDELPCAWDDVFEYTLDHGGLTVYYLD